jgi:alpha-glucosidase
LLVAPVLKPNQTSRSVYLPEGVWYDYWTGKKITGGTRIVAEAPIEVVPMYVRAGAVIPMGPEMSYVGQKPADPLTFEIYADERGAATTTLYEDDGTSPAYKQGVLRRTRVAASGSGSTAQIELSAAEGSYNPGPRNFLFVFKSLPAPRNVLQVSIDGRPVGRARAGERGEGWYRVGNDLTVRISDDGKAHRIQIK